MQIARGRDQLRLKMASKLTRTWTQPTRSARSLMGLAHEQHPLTHGPSPRAERCISVVLFAWCSPDGALHMVL